MRVRMIDGVQDWFFGKGANDYLVDINAVEQNIGTRLRSFIGDCFFDLGAGIDWWNLLGNKNQIALQLAINGIILNTDFVTGLNQVNFVIDSNRKLTVSYQVQTTFSTLTSDFVFDLNGVA